MIHAEWRMDDDSMDSIDVADIPAAFDLAYDLLFVEESTAQVVVWLSGDRNVPTKLVKANITHLGQPHGWKPGREKCWCGTGFKGEHAGGVRGHFA